MDTTLLFLGFPGGMEFVVILLVVALLFGPNRLPRFANASGRAMAEFQRGREEVERDLWAATTPTATLETTEESHTTEVSQQTAVRSDDESASGDGAAPETAETPVLLEASETEPNTTG